MPNALTVGYTSAGIDVAGAATAPTQFLPLIIRRDLLTASLSLGGPLISSNDSLGNPIVEGEYLVLGIWQKADGSINGECTIKKINVPAS